VSVTLVLWLGQFLVFAVCNKLSNACRLIQKQIISFSECCSEVKGNIVLKERITIFYSILVCFHHNNLRGQPRPASAHGLSSHRYTRELLIPAGIQDEGIREVMLFLIYWLRLNSWQLHIDWISRLITSKGTQFPFHLAITDNFILASAGKKRGRGISININRRQENLHLTASGFIYKQSVIPTLILI